MSVFWQYLEELFHQIRLKATFTNRDQRQLSAYTSTSKYGYEFQPGGLLSGCFFLSKPFNDGFKLVIHSLPCYPAIPASLHSGSPAWINLSRVGTPFVQQIFLSNTYYTHSSNTFPPIIQSFFSNQCHGYRYNIMNILHTV